MMPVLYDACAMRRIVVLASLTALVGPSLTACQATNQSASDEPSPELLETMMEHCKTTAASQVAASQAGKISTDNMSVEASPTDNSEEIVFTWRVTTAAVSGTCRFNKQGQFLEFVRQ
jgi:hypothetical protein